MAVFAGNMDFFDIMSRVIPMDYFEQRFYFPIPAELNMYYCGIRENTCAHRYGPAVRSHFLFVYVKSGKGTLIRDDRRIELATNDVLVMFPDEKIHYETAPDVPWTILWVGVYGELVYRYLDLLGITPDRPVYPAPQPQTLENTMKRIIALSQIDTMDSHIRLIGELHRFFACLMPGSKTPVTYSDYVFHAVEYIKLHYDQPLLVRAIAQALHIDISYLAKLFKKETGKTPTQWIASYRMEKACRLLLESNLSIGEVAASVGINDPLFFSRKFNRMFNMSPSAYKKANALL